VRVRRVWIRRFGGPEVLEIRDEPDPVPTEGEVRVRVEAAGVNFADVMGRLGLYPDLPAPPVVPGYEISGRVDAAAAGVSSEIVGRDVLAFTRFGGYSDVVCVPARHVFERPPGMDAREGAAFPVNYLTAYQLIRVMGALSPGETVLVHSAGGGVGLAAIQLARQTGARVVGAASAWKHPRLRSAGADHVIDPRAEPLEARVLELTGGRGVELVLDPIGGGSLARSYRLLAPTGRLGMFGILAAATGKRRRPLAALATLARMPWFSFTPIRLINANRGVFGVNLGRLWGESDRVRGWMHALFGLYGGGALRPVIDRVFPLDAAADAHHYLQDRRNFGKVLLIP
jgi:NADPH:quinone reductase-like Zn-dependent oxidoreductase